MLSAVAMTAADLIALVAVATPIFGAGIVTAWRAGSQRQQMLHTLKSLERRVGHCEGIIDAELRPNGGSSLIDKVTLIVSKLDDIQRSA